MTRTDAPEWVRELRRRGLVEAWLPKVLRVAPSGKMSGILAGDFLDPHTWRVADPVLFRELTKCKNAELFSHPLTPGAPLT